jgi:hypothetical protein
MFWLWVILIVGIIYWLNNRRTEDLRKMPQSRLHRFRRIRDLPIDCTGSVSASSVWVDIDDTCYLAPDGFISDQESSNVAIRREPGGYVLCLGPGSVRFTPRAIQWVVKQGLIRVVRVEELSSERPPSAPIRPKTCHQVERGDLTVETEPFNDYSELLSPWAEPSYQTVPLADYSLEWQTLATELFNSVSPRVGSTKAKEYRGSFSVLAGSGSGTAVKILIYQSNKGKTCGTWPDIPDGVYVLIRAKGTISEAIWSTLAGRLNLIEEIDRNKTIGIAPKHSERFAYFRLASTSNLEEISTLIAACATNS